MLAAGHSASTIKSELVSEQAEKIDVDSFVQLLLSIDFIHPRGDLSTVHERRPTTEHDTRRVFDVDPRIANRIYSTPVLLLSVGIIFYATVCVIMDPALRLNFTAFYIETNRTLFLLILMVLAFVQIALHEAGHMLAAARRGIKSKYGISNRLWMIVAESDLTGILCLPKSQRYFPMLAGLFVDILCVALLTILLKFMIQRGVNAFSIQVVQAVILDIVISIIWQFNIFVKTDIYYILCNYYSHPDLDMEARIYLRDLLYRISFGNRGIRSSQSHVRNLNGLRVFTAIWLFGRVFSLLILLFVFIPTMVRYVVSAFHVLIGASGSIWIFCDTLIYVSIAMTMLGVGMYMWLRQVRT